MNDEEYEDLLSGAPKVAKQVHASIKAAGLDSWVALEYGKILFKYILDNSRP